MACLFRESADAYYDLTGDQLEVARFIRSLDLDYLIYPELGDSGALYRQAIFRLARRQATAWGGPFTSGLATIDDFLSAELWERTGADEDYTEHLVRLPHAGLTLPSPNLPQLAASRERFGLPSGFLVSFPQSVVKWLPRADHLLAQISKRVENPIVFFELPGAEYETRVFKARLTRHGVKALWLPRTRSTSEFRAVLSQFDVALDSPGWSGGLTAMHGLSLGVPVVSLPGLYLRQRLAMGFSLGAGAPGLVARHEEDYVELATSPERLGEAVASLASERVFVDEAPLRALEEHIRESNT
jgi:predicted O-linked N-acetylglucosamine transferase (SPINDLY family)